MSCQQNHSRASFSLRNRDNRKNDRGKDRTSDPLEAQPHDPDVKALLRIAQVFDIPIANNRATADFIINSKFMDTEYTRKLINFRRNVDMRAKEL